MAVLKIDDADFRDRLEQNELVSIKFYADWCGSCKLIAPKFRRLSENDTYADIAFLESNAEENPEIRKWAGVNNLPFFVTVKNGEIQKADFTSKIDVVESMLNELNQN